MAARPVEGEHQLLEERFAVRVLRDQILELRDEATVLPELELRIVTGLRDRDEKLVQVTELALGPRLITQVCQRLTADECECGPKLGHRSARRN